MKEWSLAHPYLFTLIILFVISALSSFANKIVELFKKTSPSTVNLSVQSEPRNVEDLFKKDEDLEDLN